MDLREIQLVNFDLGGQFLHVNIFEKKPTDWSVNRLLLGARIKAIARIKGRVAGTSAIRKQLV